MSFQTYRDALTAQELEQLRAATLFSDGLPVPIAAHLAAGSALGIGDPLACHRRLIGLGLVDDWTTTSTAGWGGEKFRTENRVCDGCSAPWLCRGRPNAGRG